jgi:hypothetical protein
MFRPAPGLLLASLFCGLAVPASAQLIFESVGERALGMAGAFVAVADDATAAHWYPAGLATGGPAGATVGWHRFQFGNQDTGPVPGASRRSTTFTSLGAWPLGISYGTFRHTRLVLTPGDPGAGDHLRAETLRVSHYGVTILQTVLPGLVVGSTLKYLRGEAASGPAVGQNTGDALDEGSKLRGDRDGAFDLDVGVMASSDLIRVGVTLKNLRSPSFGEVAGNATTLPRQVRLGLAVLPVDGLTLAIDLDLNRVDLAGGLRRMSAFGGEAVLGQRLAIRSGVRWSLVGPRNPVGAVGLSVAVRPRLWLDGHFARGRLDEDQEFGVAMRAGF